MRWLVNIGGIVAWAFGLLWLYGAILTLSRYEDGSPESMLAGVQIDAAMPIVGAVFFFGLGCFWVGALLKRKD
jgi:hypothetical protein